MTIMGAAVDRDTAIVWADTLLTRYGTGRSNGSTCKLAVNALAGAAGAGRGWDELIARADAALLRATGLDEAVTAICAALRRGAGRLAPRMERAARFSFAGCGYAVAGWSAAAGRMVAWDLDARSNFEPALAGQITAPAVPWPFIAPPSSAAAERLASMQAATLRAAGHGVGRLTIATITRHGITVLPPSEIVPAGHDAGDGAQPVPVAVGCAGAGAAQPIYQAA